MAVPQVDQPGLRFPEDLPPHPNLSHEQAMTMLLRAAELSKTIPFQWKYVDKPIDGTVIVYFMQQNYPPPQDGIRYLEHEQRYTTSFPNGVELEINEQRYGYAPGIGEAVAQRVRRRYRILRGGHPNLFLYHWSRGPGIAVNPSGLNMPVRSYPLRPINEPAMYVNGEHKGKRVAVSQPGVPPVPVPQAVHPQQVAIAAQNQQMAALEARQRERSASTAQRAGQQAQGAPPRLDEEGDPADDLEHISTRSLAATRYKRNHELMSEIFMHAAFGDRGTENQPGAYSIFNKADLEDKIAKMTKELEELRSKSIRRSETVMQQAVAPPFDPPLSPADVSMVA